MPGVATLKGKYMPLSEANVRPAMVSSYDGQYVCVGSSESSSPHHGAKRDVRYCMGNYLGGGIAGVVYEAFDKVHARNVAIKILNPVGYKLCSPAALRRGEIVKKGVPVLGHVRGMTLENVYWVSVPNRRDLIACYVDARSVSTSSSTLSSLASSSSSNNNNSSSGGVVPAMLRELTLEMCVSLWLLDADWDDDDRNQRLYRTCEDPVDDHHHHHDQLHHASSSTDVLRRRMAPRRRASPSAPLGSNAAWEERKEDDSAVCASTCARSSGLHVNNDDSDAADSIVTHNMDDNDDDALMMSAIDALLCDEEVVVIGDVVHTIPKVPAKYKAFLQSRKTIYREIAHMHKLTGNSVSGPVHGGGHENVLKLYDVLEYIQPSKSTIFLVLELAHGGELFDRIRSDNGVDEAIARSYFTQLLSGVLYCHQLGIVHRDLKPENLLLSESDVLKIADFGLSAHFIAAVSSSAQDESMLLARSNSFQVLDMDQDTGVMTPARFRRLNSIVGSPHYVAPEVLQNARYGYDGRKADMWSIGVILYGLLVGNLPFGKDLATCARYLKFCEWLRSLPSDALSGKLVFDADLFNAEAAAARAALSAATNSSAAGALELSDDAGSSKHQPPTRIAQVFPSYHQPTPALVHATSLWSSTPTVSKPPASASSVQPSNDASVSALNGAGGRRGSRVVTFPSWFFPSKLSPAAVFLLASLLHPDPAKRFSCEDAYRSSWVGASSSSPSTTPTMR